MTATTFPAVDRPRPVAAAPQGSVVTDVVKSEWTKLRSVRSTYWTLLAAAVAMVGISALLSSVLVNRYSSMSLAERAQFNPTSFSLTGVMLAQLAVGVLGVLVVTAESSTGMIRTTFSAVPNRPLVLAVKAAVFAATAAVVGVISSFAAFFVGQAIMSSQHVQAHIGDPGVLRSVIGGGLYLAVLGLLALGIGALIRHSAGALAAVFGLILVLPGLVLALPSSWSNAISKFLPSNAGEAMFRTIRDRSTLSPWAGFALLCAYAVGTLVIAGIVVNRRDA